jgi:predicted metal-dependent hydrolase
MQQEQIENLEKQVHWLKRGIEGDDKMAEQYRKISESKRKDLESLEAAIAELKNRT